MKTRLDRFEGRRPARPDRLRRHRIPMLATACVAMLLSACGGGSTGDGSSTAGTSSNGTGSAIDVSTAQSASADTTAVSADASDAMATAVKTTQTVVAGAQTQQTYTCAGGGSASYTVTGGTLSALTNGQLDAGEAYVISFTGCRGAGSLVTLDGQFSVTVMAADASSLTLQTRSGALQATLPARVLTLNGSSLIAQSITGTTSTGTITTQWTSPQIQLTSLRNARTSSFSLTAVDLTRAVTTSAGSVTGTTLSGSATFNASTINGSWSATLTSRGSVEYDDNGSPTQGDWQIVLPAGTVSLQIASGQATLAIDFGSDGTVDRTLVLTNDALAAQAD